MTAATERDGDARLMVSLRIARTRRDLIDRAALASGKTRTEFIVESATRAAEDALLDRRAFHLGDADYEAFIAALDAPARTPEELRRLLAEPAPWER